MSLCPHMKKLLGITLTAALAAGGAHAADYLVAVPTATAGDAEWSKAADDLVAKHGGDRADWSGKPEDLLPLLRQHQPRWLAIVGKPETFDPAYVRALNRVTRQVDDDPWSDVRWGLITGATAADAKRIIDTKEPLVIERGLTTTGVDLSLLKSGVTLSDGTKGQWTDKQPGGQPANHQWDEKDAPEGTVNLFAKAWNETKPQLLVSSSHATQYNLEMPFGLGLIASYDGKLHVLTKGQRNEFARFLGGAMFNGDATKLGSWLKEIKPPVLEPQPDVPKVWVAAGNCLIGDARKTSNSMVVSAMSAGGVRQFIGYVVPTWFGRGGWGVLEMWQANRGSMSLADAMFLNQNKLLDETMRRFPKAMEVTFDADDIETGLKDPKLGKQFKALEDSGVKIEKDLVGLVHDRDVVALWGDPKWEATFRPETKRAFRTEWSRDADGTQVLRVVSDKDVETEVTCFLPDRVAKPKLDGPAGTTDDAVVGDDFVLFRKLKLQAGQPLVFHIRS
jgi:zinc protease